MHKGGLIYLCDLLSPACAYGQKMYNVIVHMAIVLI